MRWRVRSPRSVLGRVPMVPSIPIIGLDSPVSSCNYWTTQSTRHPTQRTREDQMPLTIHEQSEQLKAAAAERVPVEVLEVFDRSIQDFLDQGIPAGSIKAGD